MPRIGHHDKKRYAISMAFFILVTIARAQSAYFQQEVNYTITVSLNDQNHTLRGDEEIRYTNNSTVSLDTIYFHLWPNAYSSPTTALCRQMVEHGKADLFYAKPEERGRIDSLNFSVDGKTVRWNYFNGQSDICYLVLNEKIAPGSNVTIRTPFFVKIPDARFSRMGHTGQAYCITQWYPKPAVFDREGWHPMNYLDQGEFYSEYGSFDVHITLPRNYLLAATGDRIDAEEEIRFLEKKIGETSAHLAQDSRYESGLNFPPSDSLSKTVHFRQFRVHDFAWFADKRFYVQKGEIELPSSGRKVDTWIFFTGMYFKYWKKALDYVGESTIFYSYLLGDYPYNHVTAVDGTIMAGGGMEYPNITVIGAASSDFNLDMVITHEVGHNWFYGILGSNERQHPFMDEGLNSLYEMRYVRAKYADQNIGGFINRDSLRLFGVSRTPLWKYHELSYFIRMHANTDQALNLPADAYTETNYGSVIYSKTAQVFDFLLDYLGEDEFNKGMRLYYETFKFKHPSPEDLFRTLEQSSGKDLSWFRREMYEQRTHIDYKIKIARRQKDGSWNLVVKNKTGSKTPFVIQSFKNGEITGQLWTDPVKGKNRISFPPARADRFVIDHEQHMPELNRHNNITRTKGVFKKTEKIQVNFIGALDRPDRTQINLMPLAGVNKYNGPMLGLAVHNYNVYSRPFEYALVPMLGYNSAATQPFSLAGLADIGYNIRPLNGPRQVTIGVKAKSFYFAQEQRFTRLSPYVEISLRPRPANSKVSRSLLLASHLIRTDSVHYANDVAMDPKAVSNTSQLYVNQLLFRQSTSHIMHPYKLQVELQQNQQMAKIFAEYQRIIVMGKHNMYVRVFAGTFLSGQASGRQYYAFRASGYSGSQDYLYEGNFYTRNGYYGQSLFGQFLAKDGAMKIWSPLGQSTDWMVALNLRSPRAGKFPLRLFADVVGTDGRALNKDKFLWDAGLDLTLADGFCDIYLPLLYSMDVQDVIHQYGMRWYQTFRFTFNIHKFEPKKIFQSTPF